MYLRQPCITIYTACMSKINVNHRCRFQTRICMYLVITHDCLTQSDQNLQFNRCNRSVPMDVWLGSRTELGGSRTRRERGFAQQSSMTSQPESVESHRPYLPI